MAQTASNVRIDKPVSTGAAWIAPVGTALPTDNTSALNVAFVSVGYLDPAGVVETPGRTVAKIFAYGNDVVGTAESQDSLDIDFTMLETAQASLAAYYGSANVSTTSGVVTVKKNSVAFETVSLVIDSVSNGVKSRAVYDVVKLSARGKVSKIDTAAKSYPVTFTAFPNASGDYGHDYVGSAPAVPFITSIVDTDGSPTTFAVAGGGLFVLHGSGFSAATAITMAGGSVTYTIVSDTQIVGVAPAHASGTGLPIVVTNATGPSTTGATLVAYA